MPAITRLHYWFRRYVLIDLARLNAAIARVTSPGPIDDVLRLGVRLDRAGCVQRRSGPRLRPGSGHGIFASATSAGE